jgi:prevent-host-death family protein
MAIIRPVRDLRNNYSELAQLIHESGEPIHITNNGRDDTVLMSEQSYEMLKAKAVTDYKLLEAELRGDDPLDARDSLKKLRQKVLAVSAKV